jgi:hemerythrin-like domain-containing protein
VNDPIALLKKDHREAAAMLKILADGKPGARRRSTTTKLDAALQLHMAIEEDLVYPLVRKLVSKDDAKEAGIEHGLMREMLADVKRLVDEPGFGAAVAMLTAGIRHHVKEEETEVFPELKQKLNRDDLAALGENVKAAKSKASRKRAA